MTDPGAAAAPIGHNPVDAAMTPFRAITFNCAAGNPQITTRPLDFLQLDFYREILDGHPDAAILGLQEVHPEQAKALRRRAVAGHFEMVHLARPGQGNALLIPKRFMLLERRASYYTWSQARSLLAAARRAITDRARLNIRQYLELRMWVLARVLDTVTGCSLTVLCTHLSGDASLRLDQATSLFDRIHATPGNVMLLADLNVRATSKTPADTAIRTVLIPPLTDMAAGALDPRRPAIDWILGYGVEPVACRLHTDIGMMSDHFPKEATVRFAGGDC